MSQKPVRNVGILIVDDSPVISMILEEILRMDGFKVVGRVDKVQAIRPAIGRYNPDIILLDQHLPDGKGLDVVQALRSAHPNILVIMITLECDPVVEQKALQLGVAGFIHKPFVGQVVIQKIEHALQRSGHLIKR